MKINKILTRSMYTSAVVGMSVFILTLTIMVAASASTSHYKPTATEEFSGEVVQLTGMQTNIIIWNASNFGGFCYNLNDEECIGTETLTILADTLEGPDTDRIIDDTWTCTIPPTWHEYEVYSNTGLIVNGESGYWMDIFGCEKYIAISRDPNKYTKLLIEFNSTDTKTLGVGESWDLGGGLTLTALEIDVEGKEVWFSLCENGIEIDSKVDMEGQVYTYTKEIAGEEDIPFFSYYVDAISHGTNTNIVQIKYAFRIEDEIIDYSLEYATTPIWYEYELYKNLGLTVKRNRYASDSGYWTEFWMGERYIAINGNASKLARPLVEFNSTDTKTLRVGEVWDLGKGFTLSAVEIDIDGDEVWFTLSKNGEEIDSTLVGTGNSDLQTRVYTLTEDIAGESDIPIFSCYVCGVFAGKDSNIVQVKYVFLMDNDILQINTGEYYDNMEVVSATSSSVTLGNLKDLYLNQSPSTCQIMGNLSFKTIYNSSAIEFYPHLIKDELPVLSGGGGFISDCCGNNSWDLFENYTIGMIQVDLIGKRAWFVLCKDGVVVDERILTEEYEAPVDSDCRYSYVKNGTEIINATLKEAFLGCNTDMVELGEVYQRSEVDGSILINNEFHVFPPVTEPSGISWNLSDDYMFTVSDIGYYTEEVRFQLSKNGMVVKEKILNGDNDSTFTYTSGIGEINCVLDFIFHGSEGYVVKIVNVNQYSDVNGTALIADRMHFFKSADPDGIPLELTDRYVLTIKDINYHVDDKVWLELSKDGSVLKEDILKPNDLFTYTNGLESFSCVIEAVFNGCLADVVKLKNINQYSSAGVQLIDNGSKMYASADPIGDIWELWEGYSFAPKDLGLCGDNVWLSLLKDGVLVKDMIMSEDEWFRYYNSTGALVFSTYVETVFTGMNTNLVKVGYTTQYSEIDGRLFIEPDPESWQLQEGYYLTAQEIYNNNSVWLQLSKNNKLVDEGLFNDSFDLQNGTAGHTIVSGTINGHDNWNVQLLSITQYHEANGTVLTTWSSMNLEESQSYDDTKLLEAPTSISKTITVNDSGGADYTSIQAAIIASNPKDTIIVYNGTYHENIIIDKQLILIGIDMPVVDGGLENSTIEVTADDCIINGFRVVRGDPYGIYLSSSNNNLIYNNYFNNTQNAYDDGNNQWNITKTKGTNIIGGTWLGGNHWSDYAGVDENGDGLGDTLTPYNIGITNGGDYHPLVWDDPSPDTTPPVITNITNGTPTTDSITIIWDTDENSNSLVRYGTVQSNYTDTVLDTIMVSAHNIMLSGMSANTTYYFVVNSTDASNNSAQSEELNFTTAAAIAPSFTTVSIENVTLAPGESTTVPIMVNNVDNLGGCRVNLTYNASVVHVSGVLQGDMDYLTYNIDNGTGWMTANALNDSGLNGDIVFANIELNAVGTKGEETLLDITVIQLIDTGLDHIDHTVIDGTFIIEEDTEAPAVTDACASPDTILNDNGRPRTPGTNITTLSVTVTDAHSGVANVTIDLSSIGGYANEPMVREGYTDTWTVGVNAVAGINLTHHLTVNATDNKGNFNDSVCITLTVLRRGDVCRNNVIDNNDVIYIARYLADLEPECSNPPGVLVADVVGLSGDARGDSIVDLIDALYLARYIAGLEGEP